VCQETQLSLQTALETFCFLKYHVSGERKESLQRFRVFSRKLIQIRSSAGGNWWCFSKKLLADLHRITDVRGWKGPLWVTQSNPLPKQVTQSRLHRTLSRSVLNISREGDSTTSLSSLGQGSVIFSLDCWVFV